MLNKRCIEIIKYLIDNDLQLSLKEAASFFNISERSIRYDIDNINYHLEKSGYMEIEKLQKGIYSTKESVKNLELFLEEILHRFYVFTSDERREFLKIKFLFSENNRLLEIGEDLDVSLSTIKLDLKEVKTFFDTNSLELNFISKQGVVLEGKEESIRQLQLRYITRYVEIYKNRYRSRYLSGGTYGLNFIADTIIESLDDSILSLIKFFIKRIEKKLDIIISDEAFNILTFYINLCIERIKSSHIIDNRQQNREFLLKTSEYSVISQEICHLENEFSITFNESEVLVLTELFLGSHSYNFNSSFLENWIELETTVVEIIKIMGYQLNMDLTGDKTLIDGLLNHLKPAYYRIKNNISLENPIAKEVETTYFDLYSTVKRVSKPILEKYLGKDLPEEEIAYITLHFKTATDRYLSSNRKTKNLLLVCGLGYGSSKILAHKLTELYDVNIIDTIPYHKFLELKNFKDVDIIISTMDLESHLDIHVPIVKVHPILSKENKERLLSLGLSEQKRKVSLKSVLETIKETCNILDEEKLLAGLKRNLRNFYINDFEDRKNPNLKTLLNLKSISFSESASSWEEAIKKAGAILMKNGSVNEEYIKDMIEVINKNGSYMIMNNKIAFPHARASQGVFKTDMSLVRFDTPIEFPGNKIVRVILCFSSKDKKEHMDALNDFITLIERKNILDKIEYSTQSEVLQIIDEFYKES
ncbi:BglG family transcription antiterminator [Cetobacterium somerae]|uniref:BglG family transcription antiterminator n=1 Tax=Cetobacterium sp. NK01 TaxID=2993530 RepID=UPI002116A589|nr:BglG family transcription antiterminator [Cetobacterium sp. NK01]MCQ8212128.1 BglG family transcription antiterminator [Cetobacterium sp. NK01]